MTLPAADRTQTTKRLSTSVALSALLACGLNFGIAQACADGGDSPSYSLVQTNIEITVPFLAPSNDSRVSVLLLLSDAGLTRPRIPAPYSPTETPDPYVGQTPIDFDTLAEVLNDRPKPADASSDFVEGEGERCRSNAAARDGYLTALAASNAPQGEQTLLATARKALGAACNDDARKTAAIAAGSVKSPAGKEFATYLSAAADFYAGEFLSARQSFGGLTESRLPWIREAARYMIARVDLNAAQATAVDTYGETNLTAVDRGALTKADGEFRAYMRDYPNGAYAVSAHGLLRRVAWLSGDTTKLADALGEAFAAVDQKSRNVSALELAYESDNKVLTQVAPKDIHEPRLLAARDLMAMRSDGRQPAALSRAELEAQRPLFASQPALYDYLLAAYAYYGETDPARALKGLDAAKATPHMSSVAFSQQVLKGLALEGLHKSAAARAHWLALIPLSEPILQRPAIELALAQNYEASGELSAIFAKGSPIRTATYRLIVLNYAASPELLRQRASASDGADHERRFALHTLLVKELTRGRYQAFLDDLRLMPATPPVETADYRPRMGWDYAPALGDFDWQGSHASADGFTCPSIRTIATALVKAPRDERSLICLGEFLRIYGYDSGLSGTVATPAEVPSPAARIAPAELGTLPTQFPGVGVSRLIIYKAIIKNPKAAADVRAYALYRAINCWAPSGYNSCDDADDAKSVRKAWFQELKTRYAPTVWATKLKYYW